MRASFGRACRLGMRVYRHAGSSARKLAIHAAYPSVDLDAATVVEPACEIHAADGGGIEVKSSHLSRGVVLRTSGGQIVVRGSFIGYNTVVAAKELIEIGEGCQIAEMVVIRDQDHRLGDEHTRLADAGFVTRPVRIGRDVWIGAKATILKGVTIGDGAVVAAGAVVLDDVPARTVWGGVPARQLRTLAPV